MNTPRQHASHALIAADAQMSVLYHFHQRQETFSYGPYGTRSTATLYRAILGFNGQALECLESYLLGIGYRDYYPKWMRFRSPDSSSPFGAGGLNAYGYCEGDPVNYADPSGHDRSRNLSSFITKQQWQSLDPKTFKAVKEFRETRVRHETKTQALLAERDDLAATPKMKKKNPEKRTKDPLSDIHLDLVERRLHYRESVRAPQIESQRLALFKDHDLTLLTAELYQLAVKNEKHLIKSFGPLGVSNPEQSAAHAVSTAAVLVRHQVI